jgi:hypothetical protein
MTLELESYRSNRSPVFVHAPRDTPGRDLKRTPLSNPLPDYLAVYFEQSGSVGGGTTSSGLIKAARRLTKCRHFDRATHTRRMSKDEARSRHTSAGTSSSRLDTDAAAPASSGGQGVTRLSLRSQSSPASGGSTPSTSEVIPLLGEHAALKSLTKIPTLCPRNMSQAQWRILTR